MLNSIRKFPETEGSLLAEEIHKIEETTKLYPEEHSAYIEYTEIIIMQLRKICKHTQKRGCVSCLHFRAEYLREKNYGQYRIYDWCLLKEYDPHGFYYPVPCSSYQCKICSKNEVK